VRETREDTLDVLIVEDNPGDAAMIEDALGSAAVDYSTNVVTDGEEALAFLTGRGDDRNASRPDLVFLDLDMTRRGGASASSGPSGTNLTFRSSP
jgi:CheY-like chemotaxis protein